MDAITLSVMVGEDRRIVIDLPPDTPVGPVDVVITPRETPAVSNPAREAARAKLLAAGRLVTNIRAPEGTVPLSPEELLRIGQRPPGTKSLDEMIDEDRGPR
ncbi:MAG: hypothetical protein IT324_30165 [Anaerolineae bacterium]|nr:hypothetical protein [Anaerolineae bacterium]